MSVADDVGCTQALLTITTRCSWLTAMLLGLTGRGEEALGLEWRQPANWSSFTEGNIWIECEVRKFVFNCYVTLKSAFPWKPDQALLWAKKESGGFRWCVVVLFLAPLSSDESNGYRHPWENFLIAVMKSNLIRANMLVIVSWCESRKFNQSRRVEFLQTALCRIIVDTRNQLLAGIGWERHAARWYSGQSHEIRHTAFLGPPPVRWENERIKFEDIWLLICKFSLKV